MGLEELRKGRITVRVRMMSPERILNILWGRDIKVSNIKKEDVVTIFFDIDYNDYNDVQDIVKRCGGKVKITRTKGSLFLFLKAKRSFSLVIGGMLFFCIIYYLSTFVWSVEINTTKNVSPYEIRKILYNGGIIPGTKKSDMDVKEIERLIENSNRDVLWVRARVEGSSLRVFIEEKVNPPVIEIGEYGNLVANMDGEVDRVYVYSGRAIKKPGDIVKKGDVLIEGITGSEGHETEVPPKGVVIANTFIEKTMVVQMNGVEKQRSGNKDSDIYIEIFGKKFYIKKAIKDFDEYDRIEESGKLFNKVVYFEKVDTEIALTKDEAIKKATTELEESLKNELTREAIIVEKGVNTEIDGDSNLIVKVSFVIEQNIVDSIPSEY
ncbi:MAG: sporulation protein YqfD [Clostridium sp.]